MTSPRGHYARQPEFVLSDDEPPLSPMEPKEKVRNRLLKDSLLPHVAGRNWYVFI